MRLKNVETIVRNTLTDIPETRDSDDLLYYNIIKLWQEGLGEEFNVYEIFCNRREWGIPNFESVRRTRQKLQANNENLRGTLWARRYRRRKEEEYRAYAVSE